MKIFVNMEESWQWWAEPYDSDNAYQNHEWNKPVNVIEVDSAWYARYKAAEYEMSAVREQLEHMYRHQRDIEPFQDSPYAPKV